MKLRHVYAPDRMGWRWTSWLALWLTVSLASAAETNTPVTVIQAPIVAATNAPAAAGTKSAAAAVTNAPPAAATNAAPAVAAPMTPEQMFEGGTNAYNNWI